VLKNLDPEFFKEKDFNATEFVLGMLPEELEDKWFDDHLVEKENALNVINSSLFQKVMENYESFGKATVKNF
jgi:hypothetical protein